MLFSPARHGFEPNRYATQGRSDANLGAAYERNARVSTRGRDWAAAVAIVALAVAGQLDAAPRRGRPQGFPAGRAGLARKLPADVYHRVTVISAVARYHFLSRFLTMLVVIVFMHNIGIKWIKRRYQGLSERVVRRPFA